MTRYHVVYQAGNSEPTQVQFTPEEEAAADAAAVPSPQNVALTMRQLRLGLLYNGFPVTFIQDTINAIPDATDRAVAQIWYEETSTVEWGHPMTQALITAGGISQEDAATMWLAAKDIAA